MLLKVSLIVGVEVHVNVEFVKLLEPPDNQENEGNFLSFFFYFFQKIQLSVPTLLNPTQWYQVQHQSVKGHFRTSNLH